MKIVYNIKSTDILIVLKNKMYNLKPILYDELNKIDKKHKKNYWICLLEKVKINILSYSNIHFYLLFIISLNFNV